MSEPQTNAGRALEGYINGGYHNPNVTASVAQVEQEARQALRDELAAKALDLKVVFDASASTPEAKAVALADVLDLIRGDSENPDNPLGVTRPYDYETEGLGGT